MDTYYGGGPLSSDIFQIELYKVRRNVSYEQTYTPK